MNVLELQQCLDNLSSWRKRELSLARALAEQAENEGTKKYLCRAWTLIMYAHCDNFLKESAKYYIKYIKTNRPSKYRTEMIWLIFNGKDNATAATDERYVPLVCKEEQFSELCFTTLEGDAVFRKRSFRYKTLRFFCDWVLQIEYGYSAKKMFCDTLEKKRNAIAHGEEAYIDDIGDCIKWHEETVQFMDDLKDAILLSVPDLSLTKKSVT